MISPAHSLASPVTSSAYFSLVPNHRLDSRYEWGTVKTDAQLKLAVEEYDVPRMLVLAKKFRHELHSEYAVATLICEYANNQDALRCANVLKYVAPYASPMIQFWMAMSTNDPAMLRWIGQHDELARYIFLPMPCPNRDWCLEYKVDRENPGPAFKAWWGAQNPDIRQGVADHLRVEWKRRFIAQPKLYYLLDAPTLEQAVFVATRPETIWDFPVLATGYPDVQSVLNITQALYKGAAIGKQMSTYFAQNSDDASESYSIAF